ncbi:hypothetical protein ONZ43_g2972 [Nemania bipapillata]|uniref:Uncharacterized protein n=1 Tax=Nemania bipapillata TaxID=110536 RepID=A0ACC2IYJ5_9PEZI|nr:hypothetical protein ONZ43_g2972 [Nemania bipapillata]
MKSTPLIINWHEKNAPIYSAHFEPHGKGRLATGGGDNSVRIWKVDGEGEDRRVEYLSTLAKHSQAVNVVRWAPKGETLASAGDDGNVILWVPSETHHPTTFGNEGIEDKETWRTKQMFRPTGSEIYDLAWSPDAMYFIIGSMDNVARIYNAGTGVLVRQIAEHSHYVQGVTWDPLNEYIATQSSDRSVHIYSLKTKDGQYTLTNHATETPKVATCSFRHAICINRISSTLGARNTAVGALTNESTERSQSQQTIFIFLPPICITSPIITTPCRNAYGGRGFSQTRLYQQRLTFTPDGSLLLTPAGQYQVQHQADGLKPTFEVINTVYIYTRGGINKPPIAHLPGHKKPSVAVRCSPIPYTLRQSPPVTQHITIDTSSAEDPIPALPEPISKPSPAIMDPPPPPTSSFSEADKSASSKPPSIETNASTAGPKPTFALPYRMVYAVATQDAVLLYDTQQTTPICVVSNLHLATFTDLTWSNDGSTLLISSSDGFCSTLSFDPGELGQEYKGEWVSGYSFANSNICLRTPFPLSRSSASEFCHFVRSSVATTNGILCERSATITYPIQLDVISSHPGVRHEQSTPHRRKCPQHCGHEFRQSDWGSHYNPTGDTRQR